MVNIIQPKNKKNTYNCSESTLSDSATNLCYIEVNKKNYIFLVNTRCVMFYLQSLIHLQSCDMSELLGTFINDGFNMDFFNFKFHPLKNSLVKRLTFL